jgi:invasion protein IalB
VNGLLAQTNAPPPAAAPPQSQISPWRVECTNNGRTLDCWTQQIVYQRDEHQQLIPVVTFVVRPAPELKGAMVRIQLPLGLNNAEPIQIKIDGVDRESQQIQTCNNAGCFLQFVLADKTIDSMRTGKIFKLTVQDANKKMIELPLPLFGFGIAYDKTR